MTEPRKSEPLWNSWKFWQGAKKGQKVEVPLGIVSIGYFAKRDRNHRYEPVAVWVDGDDGLKRARIGDRPALVMSTAEIEEDFDVNHFQYAAKQPIGFQTYQQWMRDKDWPEGSPYSPPTARAAVAGDNSGATGEQPLTAEIFKDQVSSALAALDQHKEPKTQAEADAAQGLRSRLTSLAGEGDKVREAEKKPHLEAGRAVDGAWNPEIKRAKDGASTIKRGLDAYAAAETKRLREEAAARAATSNPVVEKQEPVRFGGAQGRSAGTKEITTTQITDQDTVYQAFKRNTEVVFLLAKLVQKHADNGGPEMRGVIYGKRTVAT